MQPEKILRSIEEIKVISDPYRLKLLFSFEETPLTVKQLAVKLDEVPSKVHYHVKELERIGVLEMVDTKEKAGIIEKYYLPTAEKFRVERNLTKDKEGQEHQINTGLNVFETMHEDYKKSVLQSELKDKKMLFYGTVFLTEQEVEEMQIYMNEIFNSKTKRENTKAYSLGHVLFKKNRTSEEEE